jgi:hypothetical protein
MAVADLPVDFLPWVAALALVRPPRLAPLLRGALFAKGRRTVAGRPRAAGPGADFPAYYFPAAMGRCTRAVPGTLLRLALGHAGSRRRLLSALDGTSAPRDGPKAQGAGAHRGPTPGPAQPARKHWCHHATLRHEGQFHARVPGMVD